MTAGCALYYKMCHFSSNAILARETLRSPLASLSDELGFKYCNAKFSGKNVCSASSTLSLCAPRNVWSSIPFDEPPSNFQTPMVKERLRSPLESQPSTKELSMIFWKSYQPYTPWMLVSVSPFITSESYLWLLIY